MSLDKSRDENVQNQSDAYYEELANQEEVYLEEREERARAVLISDNTSRSGLTSGSGSLEVKRSVTDAGTTPAIVDKFDEQLDHAVEELLTGDSDDPPLSDEEVVKMLKTS